MTAVILQWDPARSGWTGTYAADVDTVKKTGVVRKHWDVPQHPPVLEGMDVWLLILADLPELTGLLGHGIVTRATFRGPIVAPSTSPVHRVEVDFDALLPRGDHVPLPQSTGSGLRDGPGPWTTLLDATDELSLRSAWAEALRPDAGSTAPVPGALPAAAVRRVVVDTFEQDADLRRIALAYRGSVCHACGLDFEQTYGAVGNDVIDVHHITPLAHIDAQYEPDPLVDLIPLCHNCHVVAHSRWPEPYSVQEIKGMLRSGGFLRGSVMTAEQLAAEAAAARILGG